MSKGTVKVLDFGLARRADGTADASMTHSSAVMGTPAYMAPEQWEGKQADARSDIYAFGCVLYEVLRGKRVTEGRFAVQPPALGRVLSVCLAHDPEERFQTVVDLKRDLAWALEQPAPARPRRLYWAATAFLGLAAVVLAMLDFRHGVSDQTFMKLSGRNE